jgi:hypothetical protein
MLQKNCNRKIATENDAVKKGYFLQQMKGRKIWDSDVAQPPIFTEFGQSLFAYTHTYPQLQLVHFSIRINCCKLI